MSSRPTVLVPSDEPEWVGNFAEGYRACGYDVVAGKVNFQLQGFEPTIVHLLWPEEFTDWVPPSQKQIDEISATLDRWSRRAPLIFTVSNLYPHLYQKNEMFHKLYSTFYEKADVIHHLSHAAKAIVCSEYPAISDKNHIVFSGYNYSRLLPAEKPDRQAVRRRFGFADSEVVFLVIGALRWWDEARLLQRGFSLAKSPRKRLQVSAGYRGTGPSRLLRIWRRRRWNLWAASTKSWNCGQYVPSEALADLLAAIDAVLVIRLDSINSGLTSLAMSFGRFLIAPRIAANVEYLGNTDNILYEPGSAEDLARAIDRAAIIDRETVGAKNALIANEWGWERIIGACLQALPKQYGSASAKSCGEYSWTGF
jgi:hypothetical protein